MWSCRVSWGLLDTHLGQAGWDPGTRTLTSTSGDATGVPRGFLWEAVSWGLVPEAGARVKEEPVTDSRSSLDQWRKLLWGIPPSIAGFGMIVRNAGKFKLRPSLLSFESV